LNALGERQGGGESLVSLRGDVLMEAAERATGLDDYGTDDWREPFGILTTAIEDEARLNTLGRLLSRVEIVRILANRLRVVDYWNRHPEILATEVEQPVVITGNARSGTSILFELLAQDPAFRTPATWEMHDSVPPPERATYETDERIAAVDREVTFWHEIAPEYVSMHVNGATLPNECIYFTVHAFASEHFTGAHDIPTYARWMFGADVEPAYRFHRDMLKLLQSKFSCERWLLKAPSHLGVLPTLFSVYPDARVIVTHRDPARTVGSTISLMATLRKMRSDYVNREALAEQLAFGIPMSLENLVRWREEGTVPDEQFVDVSFSALMSDPFDTLRGLYSRLGREFSSEIEDRMRAYLAAKPRGKFGKHRYDLADFGLDAIEVRGRCSNYMERYRVAPEEG
jgi:hypothetical protein